MPKGTVKDLIDFLQSKGHKLDLRAEKFSEMLEDPLKETMEALQHKIKESEKASDEIDLQISDEYKNIGGQPNSKDLEHLLAQLDVEVEASIYQERLSIIHQMKTIYLFRCVETTMKDMIEIAYPGTKTKGLFVWDNMKAFFEGKEILLPGLPGYEAVIDLKKVNNNLKHSSELNDEVKKLPEFIADPDFSAANLKKLLERVSEPVNKFIVGLSVSIKDELFKFAPSRIDKIAEEFAERMSKADAERFAKALLEKYAKPSVNSLEDHFH